MRSFVKIKLSQNCKITLSSVDVCKPCLSGDFFHIINMSFNAIPENEILAKISESTVHGHLYALDDTKCTFPWLCKTRKIKMGNITYC